MYVYLSESCIAVVEALSWWSRLVTENFWVLKFFENFAISQEMKVSLCCLGRDAAGAFASRWPPNETGGWHGSGLCERDHDPHALPPERDHYFHIQTGTLHLCYPLLLPEKLPGILFWLAKSWILMHVTICWSSKTNHCVWKQRLLTHSFIIPSRCLSCYAYVFAFVRKQVWPGLCAGSGRFIQVQFYVSPIDGVKNMCGCS